MSTPRKNPRKRDTISEITVVVGSSNFAVLADMLRKKSLLNHLNRTLLHFELPDGRKETYTVWAGRGDASEHQRDCDNLNWSEH